MLHPGAIHPVREVERRSSGRILARVAVATAVAIVWGAACTALGLPAAVAAVATGVAFCAAGLAVGVAAATASTSAVDDAAIAARQASQWRAEEEQGERVGSV